MVANETLYQLSYDPINLPCKHLQHKCLGSNLLLLHRFSITKGYNIGNIRSDCKQIIEYFRHFCHGGHVERLAPTETLLLSLHRDDSHKRFQ